MSWLQDSEHARSQVEEELFTSWKGLEQEALEVLGRWQELEVDRVLQDITHFLRHHGTYDRKLLEATSGFVGSDGKIVFRVENSGNVDSDRGKESYHDSLTRQLRRKRVNPESVAYAFVERGIYQLEDTSALIDGAYRELTYGRVFSIALTREHMIIYGEKKSRASIPAADIESSGDLERNVDLFISGSSQTSIPRGGAQGQHATSLDSQIANSAGGENPQNDISALDLSYDGGQYYLEEGGQRQVLNEELWRRMEDEERDNVRYELERQSQQDPNFIWPAWIPKEDVYGPIRSRRSMMDQSFGPTPRSDSDPYFDEQRFRDDLDRYFPSGDHASGADRG